MTLILSDADTETLRATRDMLQRITDASLHQGEKFDDSLLYIRTREVTDSLYLLLSALGLYAPDADTKEWAQQTREVIRRPPAANDTVALVLTAADTWTLRAAHQIVWLIANATMRQHVSFGSGIVYTRTQEAISSMHRLLGTLHSDTHDPDVAKWADKTLEIMCC